MQKYQSIIETSADIMGAPPEGDTLAFMHSIFCQVGLPRSKQKGREFTRKNGRAWLMVQAGAIDDGEGQVMQPLPYGAFPRLALAHISTYAVRRKTPEILLGETVQDFLKNIGMSDDGRRYTTLRTQMSALAAARLQMGFSGQTYSGQPVKRYHAWNKNKWRRGENTRQQSFWPGKIELSQEYYATLLETAVPVDLRAMLELSNSALALDIYFWFAHRLHRLSAPIVIHWRSLRQQFAQEYTGPEADKNFKKAALVALKSVLMVYPRADVKPVQGGLRLAPSPAPVAPRVIPVHRLPS